MKKILLLMLAISCMPALTHAYEIKVANRTPFDIEVVCHLAPGTEKKTLKQYESKTIKTGIRVMKSIDFNVINPRNNKTYKKFFHEKYGAFTRIGDKSFTIVYEPYMATDDTVKEVDLYFIDTDLSHIADKIIPGFITKGAQTLPFK